MAPNSTLRHLTSEQIQELLDAGLPPREEPGVQEHLAACSRCRSEVEAWRGLFAQLGSLPAFDPGPAFSRVVLDQVPARLPLAARARGWIEGRSGARQRAVGHIPSGDIQDYLDGHLPSRRSSRIEAHLAACDTCRGRLGEWDGLLGSLGTLGRLGPSAGFGERVMARISHPAPVPTASPWALPGRVLAWARGLLPRSRRGWAMAAGVASAPTITVASLGFQVFSRPLLSAEAFLTYMAWKASAAAAHLLSSAGDSLVDSLAVFRAYSLMEAAAGSPLLLGMGGLALSLLSAASMWVLYRNLFSAPPREGHHAHARV